MVEFALTALVFLFLIVMIIEVARIMQAYVTIQHAAREAARYAVTGEFDPKYGINPLAGWEDGSGDPLKRIRPCWPLFWDDDYEAPLTEWGLGDPFLYEPYRGPRTCSTEESAIRSMAGLILNPNATSREPDYYEIVVSGSVDDKEPETGTFQRGTDRASWTPGNPPPSIETRDYSEYYTFLVGDPPQNIYAGANPAASRGYAGDPGKKVQVQIWYRIRMITPLLSNIAPSVKLYAISAMTVETFGSTGLQREAVLPPPDIKPEGSVGDATPHDIVAISLICPTEEPVGDPIDVSDPPIECELSVTNQGGGAGIGAGLKASIYRQKSSTPAVLEFPSFTGTPGLQKLYEYNLPPLAPNNPPPRVVKLPIDFTEEGDYYIYAWVDSVGPLGDDGQIPELIPPYFTDPMLINNNLVVSNSIPVRAGADLAVQEFSVSDSTPNLNDLITFTVRARNLSPSSSENVTLALALPANFTCIAPATCSYTQPSLPSPLPGDFDQVYTFDVRVETTAATGTPLLAGVSIASATTLDPNTANDSLGITVTVDGVDLVIAKQLLAPAAPAEVDYGISAPVRYRLTVENISGSPATGVTVTDTLSSDLENISVPVFPAGASCGAAGSVVTCNGLSVAAGATATVEIQAYVKPTTPAGTSIWNVSATVSSTQADGNLTNNTVTNQALVKVRGTDIRVTKTASAASVSPGQQFIYTITAANVGTSNAQNVNVTDVLDMTYLQPTIVAVADVGSYTQSSGLWAVGNLNVGQTATLRITVTVGASAPMGATILNTATLQAASVIPPDSNPANNSASSPPITVSTGSADLGLTKLVSPTGTVNTGTLLTYTLTITNHSPTTNVTNRAVQDTALADAISSGLLQPVSATVTGGTYASGQWTGINLNAGQSATATITVRAVGTSNPSVTPFTNTASIVPGLPPDPNSTNDTATRTVWIAWPSPVFINAGNRSSGCVQSTWGAEDPVLNKDYTWQVNAAGSAWERLGGIEQNLINLSNFHFIRHPESPVVNLTNSGQNLFGCRTSTIGRPGSNFSYRFNNLLPGNWRVVLVFADHTTNSPGVRLLTVNVLNGTTEQTLPGMSGFDIVAAILGQPGFSYNRNYVDPSGPNNDYYDVHYIVKVFDNVVVDSPGWLQIQFANASGNLVSIPPHVNGLGIEYIGP